MSTKYGLQFGPAKPKLTVLMLALQLLDNTNMDIGFFVIPNKKSKWGDIKLKGEQKKTSFFCSLCIFYSYITISFNSLVVSVLDCCEDSLGSSPSEA